MGFNFRDSLAHACVNPSSGVQGVFQERNFTNYRHLPNKLVREDTFVFLRAGFAQAEGWFVAGKIVDGGVDDSGRVPAVPDAFMVAM